jgi:hypothetical protein
MQNLWGSCVTVCVSLYVCVYVYIVHTPACTRSRPTEGQTVDEKADVSHLCADTRATACIRRRTIRESFQVRLDRASGAGRSAIHHDKSKENR